VAKLKGTRIRYISCEEVFEGRPFAKQALVDSGLFSYGENYISLVIRDKLMQALRGLEIEDDDTGDDVEACLVFLKTVEPEMFIDLEPLTPTVGM
jgi:hypothetical protein